MIFRFLRVTAQPAAFLFLNLPIPGRHHLGIEEGLKLQIEFVQGNDFVQAGKRNLLSRIPDAVRQSFFRR